MKMEDFSNKNIPIDFITPFELSREGKVKEIEQELDIIRICINFIFEKKYSDDLINKIIVMPLRKLLCESSSILFNLCPTFKMPPLPTEFINLGDNLYCRKRSFEVESFDKWVCINDWLKMIIAYYDYDENNVPLFFMKETYDAILNKIKKESNIIKDFFEEKLVIYKGEETLVICKKENIDIKHYSTTMLQKLKEIGYNYLDVVSLIKHLSDKRGAHLDNKISLLINVINGTNQKIPNNITIFAFFMIIAIKKQIPELENYWAEMPEI